MPTTNITNFGNAVSTPSLPALTGDDPTMGTWAAGETKAVDTTYADVLTQLGGVGAQFASGKTLARKDTFNRTDAGSWGTASDTHVWTTTHPGGDSNTAAIVSKTGKYTAAGAPDGPLSLLGAGLSSGNAEALVRCIVTSATSPVGAGVVLRSATDFTSYGLLAVLRDGTIALTVKDGTNPDETQSDTWDGIASGEAFWVRFQANAAVYKWRCWPDAVSEPTAWTGTYTSSLTLTGTSVGLYAIMAASGNTVAYNHYSVWTLS